MYRTGRLNSFNPQTHDVARVQHRRHFSEYNRSSLSGSGLVSEALKTKSFTEVPSRPGKKCGKVSLSPNSKLALCDRATRDHKRLVLVPSTGYTYIDHSPAKSPTDQVVTFQTGHGALEVEIVGKMVRPSKESQLAIFNNLPKVHEVLSGQKIRQSPGHGAFVANSPGKRASDWNGPMLGRSCGANFDAKRTLLHSLGDSRKSAETLDVITEYSCGRGPETRAALRREQEPLLPKSQRAYLRAKQISPSLRASDWVRTHRSAVEAEVKSVTGKQSSPEHLVYREKLQAKFPTVAKSLGLEFTQTRTVRFSDEISPYKVTQRRPKQTFRSAPSVLATQPWRT